MSVIAEAMRMVLPPEDSADELDARAASLERAAHRMFAVEKDARERLLGEARVLRDRAEVAKSASTLGLPRLDPVVFTWRNGYTTGWRYRKIPLPSLAVYSLGNPTFKIFAEIQGLVPPPGLLAEYYQDVRVALRHARRTSISSTFTGVIPDATRQTINDNREKFSSILLVAEATSWNVERPAPADPIVCGVKGKELWVLDVFDPTPLEDYIAGEFAV